MSLQTAVSIADLIITILALLTILWRQAVAMTTIKLRLDGLDRDVQRVEQDKREDHAALQSHLSSTDARLLAHEDWHRDQTPRGRR